MPQRPYVLLILLVLAGCRPTPTADYSSLELVEVTGRVTLDGIALAGARVEFESTDATCSTATTDVQGRYRLMFDSRTHGCLPGEKIVRIRMAPDANDEEDPDAAVTSTVVIPARYNADSQLTAKVSSTQRTFDFALSTNDDDGLASEVAGSP